MIAIFAEWMNRLNKWYDRLKKPSRLLTAVAAALPGFGLLTSPHIEVRFMGVGWVLLLCLMRFFHLSGVWNQLSK
jgi:hypothetical protein